jgi:hypothetical protein
VSPRAAFLALLLLPASASADFAGLPQTGTRSVAYAGGGIEDGDLGVTLGYAYDVEGETVECPTTVFLAVGGFDLFNEGADRAYATTLSGGMRFRMLSFGAFALPLQTSITFGTEVRTPALRFSLQTDAGALPGYYGRAVSFATEVTLRSSWGRFDTVMGQNGEHDFTRGGSHRLRLGLRLALVLAERVELVGRIGYTDIVHVSGPAPTYADVSAGLRF